MYSPLSHALYKSNSLLSHTVLSLWSYVSQLTCAMNYSQYCSFLPVLPSDFATSHHVSFEIRPMSWFGPGQQQRATRSLYRPSPRWGGEENRKKKAKLIGRDKRSLTEQQTKQTVATTILIRKIYKTNSEMHRATLTAWCPVHPRAI